MPKVHILIHTMKSVLCINSSDDSFESRVCFQKEMSAVSAHPSRPLLDWNLWLYAQSPYLQGRNWKISGKIGNIFITRKLEKLSLKELLKCSRVSVRGVHTFFGFF